MYLQDELAHTDAEFTLKEAQNKLTVNKFKYDKIAIYKKKKDGTQELVDEYKDKTYGIKEEEQDIAETDDKVKRYVELAKKEKELETSLKPIKEEKRALEEDIIDYMIKNDRPRFRQSGLTVYLSEDIRAKLLVDKNEAIEFLKKEGFEDIVKENYNTNSIKKIYKDAIKLKDKDIQIKLSNIFNFEKVIQVKTRATD
jgi:hypothetical protein